ncbi:MAG: DUF6249 domain-containing protein [Gammaproteobacteria bacterium]
MEVFLVPITLFVMLAIVAGLMLYYRFKTRREIQQTLRSVIDKGQELTPEVLDKIGEPKRPSNADLRRGVVAMSLGLGFAAFGIILDEQDAVRPLVAIAAFPFLVGVAYLGLWFTRDKEK